MRKQIEIGTRGTGREGKEKSNEGREGGREGEERKGKEKKRKEKRKRGREGKEREGRASRLCDSRHNYIYILSLFYLSKVTSVSFFLQTPLSDLEIHKWQPLFVLSSGSVL